MSSYTTYTPEDFNESPIYLQKKLYFMTEQLQAMQGELLPKYQMRIPYELLASLANCLLNETIFKIVKGLLEIQNVTEKHLFYQRLRVQRDHLEEITKMRASRVESRELIEAIEERKKEHRKELKLLDMRLALELDDKVKDQQETLEKAGVPGFYATSNPMELRVQMYLLDFILRLSQMEMPEI